MSSSKHWWERHSYLQNIYENGICDEFELTTIEKCQKWIKVIVDYKDIPDEALKIFVKAIPEELRDEVIKRLRNEGIKVPTIELIVLDLKNQQPERQIADLVLKELSDYEIKTIKETAEICYYNNGVYEKSDETNSLVLSTIDNIAKRAVIVKKYDKEGNPIHIPYQMGIGKQNDIVNKIKIQTFCSLKEFEQNNDLIFSNNATISFRENLYTITHYKTITKHHKTFHKLEWDYDKNATCPFIEKTLLEICDSMELVNEYYKMLAYFLMDHVKYQKAFMFYGAPSCGKTTLIELALTFIAGRNARESIKHVRNISIQDLQKPYQLAELRNALLNYFDDLSPEIEENLSIFRILVTNEIISAQMKHVQDHVSWKNRVKLLFATNELIDFKKDPEDQFWRRWVFFELCNEFKCKSDITEEDKEDPHVHEKDSDLKEKLYARSEMSGLLNKVIEAYITLRNEKEFNPKFSDKEHVKAVWLMNLNPLNLFTEECCNIDIKDKTKITGDKTFVNAINKFRKARNFSEISQSKITRRLKLLGIKRIDRGSKFEGDRFAYQGISLKPERIETDAKNLIIERIFIPNESDTKNKLIEMKASEIHDKIRNNHFNHRNEIDRSDPETINR